MEELGDAEAQRRFPGRLHVAALGVVKEPTKLRVIHDGTHGVGVNNRIRSANHLACPGPGEMRALMEYERGRGMHLWSLVGDVAKAHRRIKVRPADWGLMACRTRPGRVWVNKVGTYGLGSAAFWWGRAAAAVLVRLVHYVAGGTHPIEALLYADDLWQGARDDRGRAMIVAALLLLTALGVPWSWRKFRGG